MDQALEYIQQTQIGRVKQRLHTKTGHPCVSSDTFIHDQRAANKWARHDELSSQYGHKNVQHPSSGGGKMNSPIKKSSTAIRSSSQIVTPLGSRNSNQHDNKHFRYTSVIDSNGSSASKTNKKSHLKSNLHIQQQRHHSPSRYNSRKQQLDLHPLLLQQHHKNHRHINSHYSPDNNQSPLVYHKPIPSKPKKNTSLSVAATRPSPVISSKLDYDYSYAKPTGRQQHPYRHRLGDDTNSGLFVSSKHDKTYYANPTAKQLAGRSLKNSRTNGYIDSNNQYFYYPDLPRNVGNTLSSKYRLNSPVSVSKLQGGPDSESNVLSDSYENYFNYPVKRNLSGSISSEKSSDSSGDSSAAADSEYMHKQYGFSDSKRVPQKGAHHQQQEQQQFLRRKNEIVTDNISGHQLPERFKGSSNRSPHRRSHSVVPQRTKHAVDQVFDNGSNTDELQDCSSPPSIVAIDSANYRKLQQQKEYMKHRHQSYDLSQPDDSGYFSRRTLGSKPSSKITLPNLHKGHAVSEAPNSNSPKSEDQAQLDIAVRSALQKIAVENMTLKQYITRAKEKSRRIMNQLCEELETRSRQHRNITQTIQQLQNLKDRVEADMSLPSWVSGSINPILEQLYDALIIPEKYESLSSVDVGSVTMSTSRSVLVAPARQQSSAVLSSNKSFDHQNSSNNTVIASNCPVAATTLHPKNIIKATATTATTGMASSENVVVVPGSCSNSEEPGNSFAHQEDALLLLPHNDESRALLSSSAVSASSSVDTEEEEDSQCSNKENAMTITTTTNNSDGQKHNAAATAAAARPHIPTLSLKENNVGFGTWLSGNQTQGDTYSNVP